MANKTPRKKKSFEGVVIRQAKIDAYAAKIEKSWHKALESIFAVGDLINDAKKNLSDDEFAELKKALPFGARVAERLASIARDKRLRGKSFQKRLPVCWTTLDVLQRFSDEQLREAKNQRLITPSLTRREAAAILTGFNGNSSTAKKTSRANKAKCGGANTEYATLVFEVPVDLKNHKALMDVEFVCDLMALVFGESPGRPKIKVKREGAKPSKKLLKSYGVLKELITEVRKVDNKRREQRGESPLTKLQEVLSLLGLDPDNFGESEFSLMERIALSYAQRHDVNCIKETQLKWFAASNASEPELLGSFLEDVEDYVLMKLTDLAAEDVERATKAIRPRG